MPIKNAALLACLLLTFLLPSCISDYAPPEVAVANELMDKALDGAKSNRQLLVDAYTQELLVAYRAQMDLITKLALTNAMITGDDGEAMVPMAVVEKVNAERAKREREIELQLKAKAAEFMDDENFKVAQELNGALRRWTQKYVAEFAGNIDYILREGEKLFSGTDNE